MSWYALTTAWIIEEYPFDTYKRLSDQTSSETVASVDRIASDTPRLSQSILCLWSWSPGVLTRLVESLRHHVHRIYFRIADTSSKVPCSAANWNYHTHWVSSRMCRTPKNSAASSTFLLLRHLHRRVGDLDPRFHQMILPSPVIGIPWTNNDIAMWLQKKSNEIL